MADIPPTEGFHNLDLLPLKTRKLIWPFAPPPFPPEFFPQVGLVGLAWGSYELLFDRHLAAILIATDVVMQNKGWEFTSYRRRKELFRKQANPCFQNYPNLLRYVTQVLDDSEPLHAARNAILHGKLACRITGDGKGNFVVQLGAELRRQTDQQHFLLTADEIETLGYKIMHLAGRFNLTFETEIQGLSLADMQFLKATLAAVPEIDSILPKLPDPPKI
jgi:hypothetical protein